MSSISLRFSNPVATERLTVVVCPDLSRPDRGLDASRLYRLSAYGALMAIGSDDAIAAVDKLFSLIPSAAVRTSQAASAFVESIFERIAPSDPLALVWIVGTHAYAASTAPEAFDISLLSPSGTRTHLGTTPLHADEATAYRGSVISIECDGATASAGIVDGPTPRIEAPAVVAAPAEQKSADTDQEVIIWDEAEPKDADTSAEAESDTAAAAAPTTPAVDPKRRRRRLIIWLAAAAALIIVLLNIPTCSDADRAADAVAADSTATTKPAPADTAATHQSADTAAVPAAAEAPAQSPQPAAAPERKAPAATTPATPAVESSRTQADEKPAAAEVSTAHKNFNISPEVDSED